MSNSIRHYAAAAKSEHDSRILDRFADQADAYASAVDAMPEWARKVAVDVRVPVSVKDEHDGLIVESWSSRSGKPMHRVFWSDGTSTEYAGSLCSAYVNWNR